MQVNLATMRVECSVHGLRPEPKLAPGQPRASSPAVAIAPSSGALVVAGANALLQFYDALRDRHIDKLQVRDPGTNLGTAMPDPGRGSF